MGNLEFAAALVMLFLRRALKNNSIKAQIEEVAMELHDEIEVLFPERFLRNNRNNGEVVGPTPGVPSV